MWAPVIPAHECIIIIIIIIIILFIIFFIIFIIIVVFGCDNCGVLVFVLVDEPAIPHTHTHTHTSRMGFMCGFECCLRNTRVTSLMCPVTCVYGRKKGRKEAVCRGGGGGGRGGVV